MAEKAQVTYGNNPKQQRLTTGQKCMPEDRPAFIGWPVSVNVLGTKRQGKICAAQNRRHKAAGNKIGAK